MSETPLGSDEAPEPGDKITDALVSFTACIGQALDICSYGLTIGETYVPFDPDPDEDCEDADCSQMWVRVMGVTPDAQQGWEGDCATVMRLDVEVGVTRCLEIPEDGEAPTASDVLVAASQSMTDMNAIYCAAMGCEVWESINVGSWSPSGPLGGQYGGIWTFTVEL